MKAHREVEHKYDVAAASSVPDLLQLPGVVLVQPPHELTLEAVYFDTPEQDLTRAGVTLRRRTGGDDDGWHLELPVGPGEREEIRCPIRRGAAGTTVPKALRSLVQVHTRGRALKPLATVRNRRLVHRLLATDGAALAELCDDHVTAQVMHEDGSATATAWREWELELVEGPPKLLGAADALFLATGVTPSRAGSKLARAVGATDPAISPRPAPTPSRKGPAGVVVLAHLRDHLEKLKALDPHVRRDAPDAVHRMRVSTRRLRSALATFKPLLDADRADDLREELRWLAGVLGGARDAEVMRDRLTTMAADDSDPRDASGADPADQGGIAARLAAELGVRYRAAHDEVLRALDSRRYVRLLDSLDRLVDSPAWSSRAEEQARKALPRLVRRDWRRLRKHATAVERAASPGERDLELHEVRKAAKRLRYACEAVVPVIGAPAAGLGDAAKNLQEVLGEHQDSVVSRNLLRELADHGGITGDAAIALGRLHLIEQGHAERARGRYDVAWRQVAAKRHRRWLTS